MVSARSSVDVAYLTFDGYDPELKAAVDAIEGLGMSVAAVRWDDLDVDWSGYRAAIVRSAWDYTARHTEFLAAVRRIGDRTALSNPARVIAWNSRKEYLRYLAGRGCAVVPTVWTTARKRLTAADLPGSWQEVVVKPSIGIGGQHALRTTDIDAACAYASSRPSMMVQPYLAHADRWGEISLVFIGGAFSHAVRKHGYLAPEELRAGILAPEPGDDWSARPCRPDPDHFSAARDALQSVPGAQDLLYARIDMIRDDAGRPRIVEMELIEPFLYLQFDDEAADRLAQAVHWRLTRQ
ncbi:RimK family alpha-L-glutamate ligase [Streptomyces sp. NPDC006879]|uniref:ATP-grasp domain-containing protein n=1 Tax=Streptomyces sp. NPDC006879 TaxID=3364767 RepID=UPI00369D6796